MHGSNPGEKYFRITAFRGLSGLQTSLADFPHHYLIIDYCLLNFYLQCFKWIENSIGISVKNFEKCMISKKSYIFQSFDLFWCPQVNNNFFCFHNGLQEASLAGPFNRWVGRQIRERYALDLEDLSLWMRPGVHAHLGHILHHLGNLLHLLGDGPRASPTVEKEISEPHITEQLSGTTFFFHWPAMPPSPQPWNTLQFFPPTSL